MHPGLVPFFGADVPKQFGEIQLNSLESPHAHLGGPGFFRLTMGRTSHNGPRKRTRGTKHGRGTRLAHTEQANGLALTRNDGRNDGPARPRGISQRRPGYARDTPGICAGTPRSRPDVGLEI